MLTAEEIPDPDGVGSFSTYLKLSLIISLLAYDYGQNLYIYSFKVCRLILFNLLLLSFTVTSTEGLTATCAAAFGLSNLANWNWKPKNSSDAPIPLFHYRSDADTFEARNGRYRSDADTLPHRHFSQETASDLAYKTHLLIPSTAVCWFCGYQLREDKFMALMNLISWLTSVSTVLIMLVAGFF